MREELHVIKIESKQKTINEEKNWHTTSTIKGLAVCFGLVLLKPRFD